MKYYVPDNVKAKFGTGGDLEIELMVVTVLLMMQEQD